MALKFWWLGLVLLVVLVVFAMAWALRGRPSAGVGALVAGTDAIRSSPRFTALTRRFLISATIQVASVGLIVAGCWLLASRLGATSDANSEQHNRDIMLCLDVSDSMTGIDADLMRAFADIVSGLEGERVGLTIWNSSAIAKFPLTNDYDFILDELRRGADQVDDFDYMGGTNAGEGGSLIGDGVVSCLQRFDHLDKDRARTMILASDNSLDARRSTPSTRRSRWSGSRGSWCSPCTATTPPSTSNCARWPRAPVAPATFSTTRRAPGRSSARSRRRRRPGFPARRNWSSPTSPRLD
ncbi:hypothetical protein BW730_13685 [Tessaracoccus aquimaris]|uniref:VWFA domain-containing protein n=1 Tax=Tessaracoccus aquimaris TaxID=1332264 RepID=A0A1Q2CQJ6_9ACTN|nr:VWA domain-containing protein [Tessaracoccus aquimaris]AQP48399.1 hypothetical protein BW730_13685 [Tessaracoccus aquimaris]